MLSTTTFRIFVVFSLLLHCCWTKSDEFPELAYLDTSVNPCNDFYQYSCGNFKTVHPLPTDQDIIDHFTILQNEIHNLTKYILQSQVKDDEPVALQKTKTFYQSCIDIDYADHIRPHPSLEIFTNLVKWPVLEENLNEFVKPSWNEIGAIIAEYGQAFFLDIVVTTSHFDKEANVIYISKDRLANPDAGFYSAYTKEVNFMAESSNAKELEPYANFLKNIALELQKQVHSWKSEKAITRDIKETVKYLQDISRGGFIPDNTTIGSLSGELTIKKLQAWTDEHFGASFLNWIEFLSNVFRYTKVKINEDMKVMLENARILYGMLNFYRVSNSHQVWNYIVARVLTLTAPDNNNYIRQQLKEFYAAYNYTVYERSDYCLRKALGYPDDIDLSYSITYEYQMYHFNINKLQKAEQMIQDFHQIFANTLQGNNWMEEESKKQASIKASKMLFLLAYPESIVESSASLDQYYQNLRVCLWDHFGNAHRLRAFRRAKNLKEIDRVKNRELWNTSPLLVNAYYNRANNRVLLPIAILNPIFFTGNYRIVDYARLGAILGHEMTHGFDSAGRIYDEDATIKDWWTPQTVKNFQERAACFEDQYNNYYIKEIGKFVNGSRTLNENIADNGGIRIAYEAMKSFGEQDLKVAKYTKEQLFFIAYGTMWCTSETDYHLEEMHEKQSYSPGRFRVQGSLSNMKEFAEAFNCPLGSTMNPERKCSLF